MKRLATPWALAAGCALVVVTNAAILVSAARNRSGEPQARIEMTERELALPEWRSRDDSSLFVTLKTASEVPVAFRDAAWRHHRELPAIDLPWLDRRKLGTLGFDVALDPGDRDATGRYDRPENRRVFVALEYDGEARRRWIAGREEEVAQLRIRAAGGVAKPDELADAEALLAFDRTMRSRLVPIDAGLDAAALRRAHPDRARVLVVEGLVRLFLRRPGEGAPSLAGVVADVLVGRIRVPPELRPRLEILVPKERAATDGPAPAFPSVVPPRYRATVVLGAHLQPWLEEVTVPPPPTWDPAPSSRS